MTDPRTPRTKEAQLPDALDQTPDAHSGQGAGNAHGSEDARLFAEAKAGETVVEQPNPEEEAKAAAP
jgi:hypothetical protein